MPSNSGVELLPHLRELSGRTCRACLVVVLVLCAMSGAGCAPGKPEITIAEQEATLSAVILGSGSIFMKIINAGTGDDALVRAQVSIPGTFVDLHDVDDEGKMIRTDRIRVPAKSTVRLRPAGVHLMIFKMPKTVQEGHAFTLTLTLEKSGILSIPMQFTPHATKQRKRRY
jgi:copper(I)-binding protein